MSNQVSGSSSVATAHSGPSGAVPFSAGGCAAPDQDAPFVGASAAGAGETVISGTVKAAGAPVPGAYVRLLDSAGEFTAEVVASSEGRFRFFARPGSWTVRALAPGRSGQVQLEAAAGTVTEATVHLA